MKHIKSGERGFKISFHDKNGKKKKKEKRKGKRLTVDIHRKWISNPAAVRNLAGIYFRWALEV